MGDVAEIDGVDVGTGGLAGAFVIAVPALVGVGRRKDLEAVAVEDGQVKGCGLDEIAGAEGGIVACGAWCESIWDVDVEIAFTEIKCLL